ncbi:Aldose 1-epimerase [Lasiodiplodia theobromae]|uniref:Aldose 1-epimerase n=1 Tax=Lasiodiplodia theobromae TaxID=45133 RepID=UPI0015C2F20E|nr:Aldose 1-epimerase [Lasiodiplodia theobromae]KAF4537872.1 Aldose 1-epimerase [Lasiodiplodia theobromae]
MISPEAMALIFAVAGREKEEEMERRGYWLEERTNDERNGNKNKNNEEMMGRSVLAHSTPSSCFPRTLTLEHTRISSPNLTTALIIFRCACSAPDGSSVKAAATEQRKSALEHCTMSNGDACSYPLDGRELSTIGDGELGGQVATTNSAKSSSGK